MKKSPMRIMGLLLVAVLAVGSLAYGQEDDDDAPMKGSIAVAKGTSKENLVKLAKITFQAALNAALKKVPGSVVDGELQTENDTLVYDFEIVTAGGKLANVVVDAGNGAILDAD
jgi:uncharacterized membrane protein YkoI